MTRKPGSMYREIRGQAYTRKEYMGGVPGIRISQFDIGDLRATFPVKIHLVAREPNRDGRRGRPHLRGHARGVRRSGRHGGPSQAGHEDLHDLDDGGPRRGRERGAPERRRETADPVVPRDPEGEAEALTLGTGFSRAAGLPPRSWAIRIVSWT